METNVFHLMLCVTSARTHKSTSLCFGHFNSYPSLSLIHDLLLEISFQLSVFRSAVNVLRCLYDDLLTVLQSRLQLFFQDFSGQDPNILLSHLLARTWKPYKKRETPDCFWKYCV
ncbi:urotensin-2 [Hylobates moloch]|uniref:urotensin-2 n=1 Tax=Hylobates moloch TaxID=81572 RepID=UPI0013F29383|nr:urotensin-2 [Hylobates moloch]